MSFTIVSNKVGKIFHMKLQDASLYRSVPPFLSHEIQLFVQKASEYDQEIPQSHTTDQPTALRGRATEHQEDSQSKALTQGKYHITQKQSHRNFLTLYSIIKHFDGAAPCLTLIVENEADLHPMGYLRFVYV